MQNMQNIDMQKSKISESESSINSRTCLGHLVLFLQLAHLRVFQIIFLDPFPYYDIENLSQKEEEKILWNMFLFL